MRQSRIWLFRFSRGSPKLGAPGQCAKPPGAKTQRMTRKIAIHGTDGKRCRERVRFRGDATDRRALSPIGRAAELAWVHELRRRLEAAFDHERLTLQTTKHDPFCDDEPWIVGSRVQARLGGARLSDYVFAGHYAGQRGSDGARRDSALVCEVRVDVRWIVHRLTSEGDRWLRNWVCRRHVCSACKR